MINFIEEAHKLISINSISQNGNEEIAVYLQSILNRTGMKTLLQEVSHSLDGVSKRQFNLVGIMGDPLVDRKTKKGLLLNTHLDTVSPGLTSHWTETAGDPFCATIKENKVFGLGSADVKLDFLCKLKAIEKYKERKLKMPIYLVGTAAEEIGMLGAKYLIKSLALNPKYVLVGEPSELSVIYAHKAFSLYQVSIGFNQLEKDAKGYNTKIEIKFFGRASHGSYPDLGENAILKMMQIIQRIREANFDIKIFKMGGGDSANKVPDFAAIEFYLASGTFDDFRRFFRENLNQKEVQVEFGGLGETGKSFYPDNLMEAVLGVNQEVLRLKESLLAGQDQTYNPPTSTMNFSKINSKPNGLDMTFDFRLLPTINPEEFDQEFKRVIQDVAAKHPNLTMKISRLRHNPSLNMQENSELVKAAFEMQKSAGIDPKLDKKSTSTEAAQYFAAGFDAIIFGPGKSMGNSHTPNEHNIIDQLDKAVHFYDRMIERFCV